MLVHIRFLTIDDLVGRGESDHDLVQLPDDKERLSLFCWLVDFMGVALLPLHGVWQPCRVDAESVFASYRKRLPPEVFAEVFQFVLRIAEGKKLLSGKTVGVRWLLADGLEPYSVPELYMSGFRDANHWVDIEDTIELKVTRPLEEALNTVQGLERVQSITSRGTRRRRSVTQKAAIPIANQTNTPFGLVNPSFIEPSDNLN